MSDITLCQRCHVTLDPRNRYVLTKMYDRKIVKSETVCKNCFLKTIIKDYQEKGIFNLVLAHGISENDPVLQQNLDIKTLSKLLATCYKVDEKIAELEIKIWFPDSLFREKLISDSLAVGDLISYRDSLTLSCVTVQKQSGRTVIWINDTFGSMIEISIANDNKQSLTLSNISATLPNTLTLLDWVINNYSVIASNLC